ncbi:DUF2281 domain-containing protein [Gloeomargaritales cyanobacterium VI4D9]|nr:DUF2281 domain-containing protein [Gloeomargaritales cyanobacterium VI4D9]
MLNEIIGIVKSLPPTSQQEILDFARFVQRQYQGKVERRNKRNRETDPPMYRGI